MIVTLRGCRGSIAVPGVDTLKYGGNTTCIDARTNDGDQLIFDAGTGIRELGLELMAKTPAKCAVFLTHTHWDHIQGLPFFVPLFVPGSKVDMFGSFDPVYGKTLQDILSQQMQYCYFPVRENELKADISYTSLRERQAVHYGSAIVTNIVLNHPVLNYGYKVEADGGSFFFTGDYEPPINIYSEDDEAYEDYQEMIDMQQQMLAEFLADIDALIIDAQYTDEEYYKDKIGWGHGTYSKGVALAKAIGVPRLYMTHHDPTRTDAALDAIYAAIQASELGQAGDLEIVMASEGLRFSVGHS